MDAFAIFFTRYLPAFADGFLITAGVAALAAPAALIWAMVLIIPRLARWTWASLLVDAYVEVMRNSPLLVQMYLLYFGLPLLGLFWSSIVCGVIAIASQHGAFLSEILRSGIQSLSQRQWEAGSAIGMRKFAVIRLVILPQAFIKVLPALGNQLIVLVKDTSLVSAIGVMDLTLTGKMTIERSGASFEAFIAVAFFYLILTSTLGLVLRIIEVRAARRYG
ncbi:amino acid ABC transporter permease [Rhizobium sp. 1AS11]|uniref:amino acid ABC transporter permease n=1 Tax=Rhizobium acaciae TaxID=2989736 RepID=UPI002222DE2A|nr:amino acid ABC transporter permease [Rhizobium acaciae]MCW1411220.1 amino acid ABC transporter permease [Rhizobium acaciae]MCW1743369.1 amino acid ABC transporter permease [Rhizobium acaciae]